MTPLKKALSLPVWQGVPQIIPLGGGITNINFVVEDDLRKVVVRIGDDIPVHQIMRFNELGASRAAHAAGVSPAVLYHEPGALVIEFVQAKTLTADDFHTAGVLDQAVDLVARAHRDIPQHLRGPVLTFWVFHVIRDYAGTLRDANSVYTAQLAELLGQAAQLEAAVGPIDLVFGHNDLLPANFLLSEQRMWLIDWDYAGFNSPLFDLGGLAANTGLTQKQEEAMLARYFDRAPSADLVRRYHAMKAAAALRETMWSMISEIYSELDFDFSAYTARNLLTYRAAFDAFKQT